MIPWFTWLEIGISALSGLVVVVMGLAGRRPNDLVLLFAAVVEVVLIAQLVISIASPAFGNLPTGDGLEFWVYLISAILLPPAAAIWGLLDRGRWSTVVIGVALLAVAIMAYRMGQIWFVQAA